MKSETLLRDPVFQLNLLIWMSKEQPASGYRVRPFFVENGFDLIYIEQPFAFPDATIQGIDRSALTIKKAPEPETILGRKSDQKALYFEAKSNSFSPESTNSSQARGHLLACGPAFGEALKPLRQALLCYVLPQDRSELMRDCLYSLSAELRTNALEPGGHSVHGLAVNNKDLIYSWDDNFKLHAGIGTESVAVLHDVQEDTDPSPLLLIYTDEDCPCAERAGFYRKVLLNQVVAKLVCDLNLLQPGNTYAITARELLRETTDGILDYLGRERQSSMIRVVRQNLFTRITSFWRDKTDTPVKQVSERLEITFKDFIEKSNFLEWLEDSKRTNFNDDRPPADQPNLPNFEVTEE